MILLWQGTYPPVAPLLNEGQRGQCSRHASILWRPCAYYATRTLFNCCCIMCHCNEHKVSAVSWEKEQLITATGGWTQSVLRQRSSQPQKYDTRMSRRIAVDQIYAQGCQFGSFKAKFWHYGFFTHWALP